MSAKAGFFSVSKAWIRASGFDCCGENIGLCVKTARFSDKLDGVMRPHDQARTKSEISVEPIVAALERDIIFGEILPRQRILEDEIVYRFDVKRHVARRALEVLANKGMMEKVPNKGTFVRHFSYDEMMRVYEVREALHHAAALHIKLPAGEPWLYPLPRK